MKKNDELRNKIKQEINLLVDKYFENEPFSNTSNKYFHPLVLPSYDQMEVKESIDSLLSSYVTMGKKCRNFEINFSNYIGMKHGLFVNSGSSANLIALSILSSETLENHLKPGDEIITPALTWSTSVFPIYNVGAIAKFVDVNPSDLTIDINEIESTITNKTRAIMPIHLLGNPCDMDGINKLAKQYDLFVIEDSCEAHGASIQNRKIGSFGHLSTFSFFFSHHISTIEGGMVLSNDQKLIDIGRSIRAHGWVRERSDKESLIETNKNIDRRFLFIHPGYNLRPTEIQGAFGIHQLKKLDFFVQKRREFAEDLLQQLNSFKNYFEFQKIRSGVNQSWFGFSFIVKKESPFTRDQFMEYLETNGIETRPIMGGNFVVQPVMELLHFRNDKKVPNADYVSKNGVFIGLHHLITKENIQKIVTIVSRFVSRFQQ